MSILSVLAAVNHYYIQRNYFIYAEVPCDPFIGSCFIGEGTGMMEFYKQIQKIARLVPVCDGWNEVCPPLRCTPNEPLCEETYCETGGDVPCTSSASQ